MLRVIIFVFISWFFCFCEASVDEGMWPQSNTQRNKPYSNIPETYGIYPGLRIISCGPRGGEYVTTSGEHLSYRIFRVEVINDSIYPAELNVYFSGKRISLNPGVQESVQLFLLPDELGPDSVVDINNFGVRGLMPFLDTCVGKPTILKKLISPKQTHILYITVITNGMARGKLSAKYSDKSLEAKMIFDLQINPPNFSTSIECGQIQFND